MLHSKSPSIIIIGAGIGGLTTAALLAQCGYHVILLEAQTYPGGCAGTFFHKGYRFDAGATVAGGFQPNGPHAVVGKQLGINWPVKLHEPAWVVHLPDRDIALTKDNTDILNKFPESERFWREQLTIADLGWSLSAQGLPWPPTSTAEFIQLVHIGLDNFPRDLRLLPFAFRTAYQWLQSHHLSANIPFLRFIDAQLLIAAQTTTQFANSVYSATALDLARQGVYHVKGGIGGLAETLAAKVRELGGEIRYRQRVTKINIDRGRVTGVYVQKGRYTNCSEFTPCDFLVGNLTPWSLDSLLGESSPVSLKREIEHHAPGLGAFALYVGVEAAKLPHNLPDHHQIIADMQGPMGEGRSLFISISPTWDTSRAPAGMRAVTVTTHTSVQAWWDALKDDVHHYEARKQAYAEMMLNTIEKTIPGFKQSMQLLLPGSPVTYNFYTNRHLGMVGGFPQKSLFQARGPRTGIPNLRLVGDSIFPGQSTAGVTLGAMRVARDIQHTLPVSKKILFRFSKLPSHNAESSKS
jgi:C-3',4' desaturase CrtD